MRLKLTLSILLLIACAYSFAQKKNVYYLNKFGKEVSTRDSADFIRKLSQPDSGSNLINIKDSYPDGKIKLLGKSSTVNPVKFEGQCTSYYDTDKKESEENYKNGNLVGLCSYYYPSGVLKSVENYIDPVLNPQYNESSHRKRYLLVTYNDSTGKALVVNGNGRYRDSFYGDKREGQIVNGQREGEWKRYSTDDKITITEQYKDGQLISSIFQKDNGTIYRYDNYEVYPQFEGGIQMLFKYLQQNIRYPLEDNKARIQGKVLLSFVIEKTGDVADVKIIRGLSNTINQEAVRVISQCPQWQPGIRDGRPIRVKYTIPINFLLQR